MDAESEYRQPGEGKSKRAKKNAKRKAAEMEKKNQTTSHRDEGGKDGKKDARTEMCRRCREPLWETVRRQLTARTFASCSTCLEDVQEYRQ